MLRRASRMSREQMAVSIGMPTKTIARIESGARNPSISLVKTYAYALGIKPYEVFVLEYLIAHAIAYSSVPDDFDLLDPSGLTARAIQEYVLNCDRAHA